MDFETPDLDEIAPIARMGNARTPFAAACFSTVARALQNHVIALGARVDIGVVMADLRKNAGVGIKEAHIVRPPRPIPHLGKQARA
ncbi:hypothetical protein QWZ10_20205 [Paracoccus cavernae]|uniref:Uncharacterized protein n=1 Tax=Paracoccus cavernae TaxID=1571207 RepID=A0ABT8DAN7_9RHOB|nr:hypothetical protein [Paracoccus cavernae]